MRLLRKREVDVVRQCYGGSQGILSMFAITVLFGCLHDSNNVLLLIIRSGCLDVYFMTMYIVYSVVLFFFTSHDYNIIFKQTFISPV